MATIRCNKSQNATRITRRRHDLIDPMLGKIALWSVTFWDLVMVWWHAVPAVFSAAAIVLLPGLALTWAIGARHFMLLAFAPLASTALIGVSGVVSGFLGMPWGAWFFAVFVAFASLAVRLLRRVITGKLSLPRGTSAVNLSGALPLAVAVSIPAVMIGSWQVVSMGDFNGFSQAFDNTFHLNAIAHILHTGNASSLTLGQMINPDRTVAVYPAAWHSSAALISEVANVSVIVAENALTLVVCALVWPLSCIALVRGICGNGIFISLSAGLFSASFWVFPYYLVQRGPLFPNVLSYSILPLVILTLAWLLSAIDRPPVDKFGLTVLLLLGIAALFTSQPNGFTALMAIALPMLLGAALRLIKTASKLPVGSRRLYVFGIVALASAVTFAALWVALLIPYSGWSASRTFWEGVGDVVSGGLLGGSPTWVISAVMLAGVATILLQRRGFWMLGSYTILACLYLAAASAPSGLVRHLFVGSWYEDTPRLAALLPIGSIMLAAKGVQGLALLAETAHRGIPAAFRESGFRGGLIYVTSTSVPAVTAGLVVSLLVLSPIRAFGSIEQRIPLVPPASTLWDYEQGTLLSTDELTLISRLTQNVPNDAVLAVNPFNGSSLAYAISGLQVTQPNLSTSGPGPGQSDLAWNLAYARPDSSACKQAREENIRYILDFGVEYIGFYQAALLYPGVVKVGDSQYVTLVDREGEAKLYELTGCFPE